MLGDFWQKTNRSCMSLISLGKERQNKQTASEPRNCLRSAGAVEKPGKVCVCSFSSPRKHSHTCTLRSSASFGKNKKQYPVPHAEAGCC